MRVSLEIWCEMYVICSLRIESACLHAQVSRYVAWMALSIGKLLNMGKRCIDLVLSRNTVRILENTRFQRCTHCRSCSNSVFFLTAPIQPDMPIPAGGVTMQVDAENRGTGEAYVEFVKPDDAEKALYKNRQMMGHRYIIRSILCM